NVIVNPTSKYGVLAGVAVAAGVASRPVFCAVCPIGNTCRAAGMQGVMLGLEALVIPVFAGLSFIKERFWCRYLCPVGAVLALTDKVSLVRVKLPAGTCVRCKRCENACPMAAEPWTNTHKQLKEDPAVLDALMEKGLPDALYRPVPLQTLGADVQNLLESKSNYKRIPGGECIRCYECAASCPLLNEQKEISADIAAEKPMTA
ncbi:MAG: 4Fe-4S dicluster domain-containing protein, partial [Clostridiales bacterium]|nr:4Fe-4S dicluster domain-containing protein [Clostridiales bacterium]